MKRPSVVVDLGRVEALQEIRTSASGLEIGAMAVANGVAPTPVRLTAVGDTVRGQAATAARAGEVVAILGVPPLVHKGYKVPLLRNLVMRSLRGTAA